MEELAKLYFCGYHIIGEKGMGELTKKHDLFWKSGTPLIVSIDFVQQ